MKVCAITATKNRHTLLERSVSMFLDQDYDNCVQLIYNNSDKPLILDDDIPADKVILINNYICSDTNSPYTTLGDIYNDALKYVPDDVDLICFWDDDDIFLKNHISEGVKGYIRGNRKAYKPKYSYFKNNGSMVLSENVLEPSIFVDLKHVKEFGFSKSTTPQHLQWLDPLIKTDQLFTDPEGIPTLVYDWDTPVSVFKASGDCNNPENFKNYEKNSLDVGDYVISRISTIPDNLIFIQVVSDEIYFQWQVEVQITNFRKFNVSDKMEILVWHTPNSKNMFNWKFIERKYPEVKFFYYKDEGVNLKLYIPQLRPHTLKKHFKEHSERLKDKVFFYHDADIIFNRLPNFRELLNDDICWQSDTSSYLDYNYLKTKEIQAGIKNEEIIKTLAEIGSIRPETIKEYAGKTGGAQVILKNIDYKFWEDVEKICIDIRKNFFYGSENSINRRYFRDENAGVQSWCADMWALNFALWSRNKVTDISKELDFSWATDDMKTFKEKPIFHNAGATDQTVGLFYKGAYIARSPIGMDIELPDENKASRAYVLAIKEVK